MVRYVVTAIVVFGILLVIYLAADRYMRWDLRRRLEDEHADQPQAPLTRDDFVQKGLADYERSPEKKVLLLIFVIPFAVIALLALFLN